MGGTTPSAEDVESAVSLGLDVIVLIRPRPGGFRFNADEFDAMKNRITVAEKTGASGVAFEILTEERTIDEERCRDRVEHARPLEVCFHRAFDATRDTLEALETLVGLGVDRVLTSGGAAHARSISARAASRPMEVSRRARTKFAPTPRLSKPPLGYQYEDRSNRHTASL